MLIITKNPKMCVILRGIPHFEKYWLRTISSQNRGYSSDANLNTINNNTYQFSPSTSNARLTTSKRLLGMRDPVALTPSARSFAARKGTRARKAAKKVQKETVKKEFLFDRVRKQLETPYTKQRPFDDSHYPKAVDDVYFSKQFQSRHYPFAEAIQNFREVNHPTMYNLPSAPVLLRVNIDLTYPKRPNK